MREWAKIAKQTLIETAGQFRITRGEPIGEQSIKILVELLKQLRGDYLLHIIRQDSDLTRYDSAYQAAADSKQEEQFWGSWEPLFRLANAYNVGASEQPPPGIGRVEFELKREEWSSEIRQKLDAFTKQFVGVLTAFMELPEPS